MAPQGAPGNSSHYRPRMRNGPWIPGGHASPSEAPTHDRQGLLDGSCPLRHAADIARSLADTSQTPLLHHASFAADCARICTSGTYFARLPPQEERYAVGANITATAAC